nr:carboxylesterase 1 [Arma chinensis]
MDWLCLFIRFFFFSVCVSSIQLKTRKGIIQGSQGTSKNGRSYHIFMAVPYAQPPVGELRFMNPLMHNGWEGTLDATDEATPCIQKIRFSALKENSTIGEENCLYLNIYTPSNLDDDGDDDDKKLPVMVYIHGGGFRWGNPGPKNSEKLFMDEDVILVTVQYRLGILGFLSTEDSLIPGNFGLKDQAMALRWVKENINEYGGNPNLIVAFGESAGGASVHYLLTSPLSRDLLKGGISQSGVIDAPWGLSPPGLARKYAILAASMVGCGKGPLLECLQSLPVEQLATIDPKFTKWDLDPIVIFQPVIEVKNNGVFMKEDPRNIEFTLPWITGITNGEGNIKSAALLNEDPSVFDYFIENIDEVLATIMHVDPKTPKIDQVLSMVKNRYFQHLTNKNHILKEHEKLCFDLYFAYPMKKALERHKGLKYAYFFSHRRENTIADLFGPIKLNSTKACHGDDMASLFYGSNLFPDTKERPEDKEFSEHLVHLWVNFAKSVSSGDGSFNKQWKPFSNNNFLHMKTKEFIMEHISFDYLLEFWSKAFNLIKQQEKDEL